MKNRNRTLLILSILFIVANIIIFNILNNNKDERIKVAIQNHKEKLNTHYEILLHHQKMTANASFKSTVEVDDVVSILSKVKDATKEQQNQLRKQLIKTVEKKYEILKTKGVLQYQFVLPNNISFLRMHKPSKYGDDLSSARADFVYVNKHKKIVRGFEQGKTAHGFRHVYPIFDKKGNYIAAAEVSFSSEILQEYLTKISKLHTHFLVDKEILKARGWDRDDMVLDYRESAEHLDYMITMTKDHSLKKCIVNNKTKLLSVKDDINKGIKSQKSFSTYVQYMGKVQVISFHPIKNIRDNEIVAWIVSYEYDKFIAMTIKGHIINMIVASFVLLCLFYFLYRIMYQKEILDSEIKNKTQALMESKYQLQEINENLEQKIIIELDKNKKTQEQLFKSEKMAAMGEMIGNIAHQWRQPLSVISTGVTGLKMQKEFNVLTDEAFHEICDTINNNAQYLSKTIDDFKNFIRGDQQIEQFNLSQYVESFLHIVEATIKKDRITVIKNLDDEIELQGYPNELIQCFINLFNNSKDAMAELKEEDRVIFLKSFTQDDYIVIEFQDNGGGIQESIIDKIFEPYFTTKHKSQGTGLGMHMTYNLIVNGMNGNIELDNNNYTYNDKEYYGAQFRIVLPKLGNID